MVVATCVWGKGEVRKVEGRLKVPGLAVYVACVRGRTGWVEVWGYLVVAGGFGGWGAGFAEAYASSWDRPACRGGTEASPRPGG